MTPRSLPLVLAAGLVAACSSTDDRSPSPEPQPKDTGPISIPVLVDDAWTLTVAHEGDVRINGVACGELDPQTPGDEIVTVDQRGRMRIFRLANEGFEEIELGEITAIGDGLEVQGAPNAPSGELVQVICADLAPRIPGDEIIAVGKLEGSEDDMGPGLVRVYARAGVDRAWVEYRHVTPGLVHAITSGDVDPNRMGTEFLFAGFFGEARIGRLELMRGRPVLTIDKDLGLDHAGNAKGATVTDDGFVLACDDGGLVEFGRGDDGRWAKVHEVDLGPTLARIATMPDGGVLVCDNDGVLQIVRTDPSMALTQKTVVLRAPNRLRGAVLADLDPDTPGIEAATAGYDGEIRLIRHLVSDDTPSADGTVSNKGVERSVLARDTAKIHHLTSGTFRGLGLCLVSCGYSGDVLVVSRNGAGG